MPGLYPRITGIPTKVTLLDVPESTSDTYGQPVMTATAIGEFYATVIPILSRGRELLATKQVYPQSTHIVTMGHTGDAIPSTPSNPNGEILTRMKLQRIDNNHILNIITAEVDPDTRGWVCICEKHEGATT
jgi:hypothetical protein